MNFGQKPIYSIPHITKMEVVADHGMIVSESLAAEAGIEIMQKGGNAVDAAIATAFADCLYEPEMCGIGGGGGMIIYMAETGENVMIEYNGRLPKNLTEDFFVQDLLSSVHGDFLWREVKDHANIYGYRSLGVPGMLAGMSVALENYGTMSLKEVFQPAIRLAENGFPISEKYSLSVLSGLDRIIKFPETTKILLNKGFPPQPLEMMTRKDLARSFKKIAEEGTDVFYKGEIARTIVKDAQEHGGIITEDDYAAYQPRIYKPALQSTYHNYKILTAWDAFGGTTLIHMLNLLEGFGLAPLGHNSVQYIHILAEVMRICWTDRFYHMGDPEFEDVPILGLISKDYGNEMRKHINLDRIPTETKPGDPWKYMAAKVPRNLRRLKPSNPCSCPHTTHLGAVDKDRNMVSLTTTMGGLFGSFVTPRGTGIIMRNYTNLFNPEPGTRNSLGPWKRPLSHQCPTLVLKDNKPFITVGAPGGRRLLTAVMQVILNVVSFDMSMQEAIASPRIHYLGSDPKVPEGKLVKEIFVSSRIPGEIREGLRKMGYEATVEREGFNRSYFAWPLGIMIDQKNGRLRSGVEIHGSAVGIGF